MRINKSKSYVLPMLDGYIKINHINLIYNTYLFLEGKDEEYIIVQYEIDEKLNPYLEDIKTSNYLVDIIYQEQFIYVLFNVPDEIKSDYYNFVGGNFSKIKSKDKIISFLKSNYGSRNFHAIDRIKKVLYRDKALKEELEFELDIPIPPESELSSIPSKQSETLKL